MQNKIHTEAFKEACTRYPESIGALVFLASACGLLESPITSEHINWAREQTGLEFT